MLVKQSESNLLAKDKIENYYIIIDIKIPKEELEKYNINREAIIINAKENVKYDAPCFAGINVNYFNIQFVKNRPVLIDTTSFEIYREGEAWCAYRQFCAKN